MTDRVNSGAATSPDATPRCGQRAVFLSYAKEDAGAAANLCEALRAGGIEVWFDQSELRGGDAWDATIRRQIKTCALFIPLISRHSHARDEGYFRLEWKLAIDRSHLIAADRAFLLPVVIDDTSELDDRIPERFRDVQWIRLADGTPPTGFVERVAGLLARAVVVETGPTSSGSKTPGAATPGAAPPSAPAATRGAPAAQGKPRQRAGWWIAAAALAAVVAVAAVIATRHGGTTSQAAPYSLADRRMTFAVLPIHVPPDDERAAHVAQASMEAVLANIEAATIFAQTAPRARVEATAARLTGARELATALDVHFLIRGSLVAVNTGYTLSLVVIDGATEQPLATETLAIAKDALRPAYEDDVDTAVFHLVIAGMHAEVTRAEQRPDADLDVRDLSFRALDYWRHHAGTEARKGYASASELLKRALALAPDDPFATYLTAQINLCDCVMGWSKNPEEQRAIGTVALDRYLRIDPTDVEMLLDKAGIFMLRDRYEEALVIADSVLKRHPDSSPALSTKAAILIRLDRAAEAVTIMDALVARYPDKWEDITALAADAHYAVGDYTAAATLAANAAARTESVYLTSPVGGEVRLTLAAAEARGGRADRARRALEDFYASVPTVRTITALRHWLHPTDALAAHEPFYAGLKLAGMPE